MRPTVGMQPGKRERKGIRETRGRETISFGESKTDHPEAEDR